VFSRTKNANAVAYTSACIYIVVAAGNTAPAVGARIGISIGRHHGWPMVAIVIVVAGRRRGQ
jgi:hypothetical protein